jgi:hypothetical protein
LLLQRLGNALTRVGDFPSACFELLFQIGADFLSSTNAKFRISSSGLSEGEITAMR